MPTTRPIPGQLPAPVRMGVSVWLFRMLLAGALIITILSNLALWPIPSLGVYLDLETGTIQEVEPGSLMGRAGIAAGDRIVQYYDVPWLSIDTHLFVKPLNWDEMVRIPLRIERSGTIRQYFLSNEQPSLLHQAEKLAGLVLAGTCLLVSLLIEATRRQQDVSTRLVSGFWLLLGAILGVYTFVLYNSYPILLVLRWMFIGVVTPLAIYTHYWFPIPPAGEWQAGRLRWLFVFFLIVINSGALAMWAFSHVRIIQATEMLGLIMPSWFILAFVGSTAMLMYRYRQTAHATQRRQARVIAFASGLTAVIWSVFRLIPFLVERTILLPDFVVDFVSITVPLAYLLTILAPDLYRVEQLLRWLVRNAVVSLVVLGILAAVVHIAHLSGTVRILTLGLGFAALYTPVFRASGWLEFLRSQQNPDVSNIAYQMSTTLDQERLSEVLCRGIAELFGTPPVGLYLSEPQNANELTLVYSQRFHGPQTVHCDDLAPVLSLQQGVITQVEIERHDGIPASSSVFARSGAITDVVLWCVLRAQDDELVGIMVLGQRSDFEPYRPGDIQALHSLRTVATLAFTNSFAFTQQALAERRIRHLYEELQRAHDATASAIAREIHDEVINVNVRLNIATLERINGVIDDPFVRSIVDEALEGERTLAHLLRFMCESLRPTGLADPWSLQDVLREMLAKYQSMWAGTIQFRISGKPCSIDPRIQWEAFRIARESVNNVLKHAGATEITIDLAYPSNPNSEIVLSICDNGAGINLVKQPVRGWGLRYMEDGAAAVGGTLRIERQAAGGTCVEFSFRGWTEDHSYVYPQAPLSA